MCALRPYIIVLHIAHEPDEKLSWSIYKTCRVAKLKACVFHFSKNRIFFSNSLDFRKWNSSRRINRRCSAVETLYATILFHQWAAGHEFDHLLKSGGAIMGSELQRDADDDVDSEKSHADSENSHADG